MVVALLAGIGGVSGRLLRIIVWVAIVTMVVGAIGALRRRIEPPGPQAVEADADADAFDEPAEPRRRIRRIH